MKMLPLLLFILLYRAAAACHPECRWACDDPVCQAVCQPVCETPVCVLTNATHPSCSTFQPSCSVQCPANMCESDSCPQCETVCQPPSDLCNDGQLLCEATSCTWYCQKPTNCPYPRCELQCERPACETPASGTELKAGAFVTMLFLIAFISS